MTDTKATTLVASFGMPPIPRTPILTCDWAASWAQLGEHVPVDVLVSTVRAGVTVSSVALLAVPLVGAV
jgi:hypothetical protein